MSQGEETPTIIITIFFLGGGAALPVPTWFFHRPTADDIFILSVLNMINLTLMIVYDVHHIAEKVKKVNEAMSWLKGT